MRSLPYLRLSPCEDAWLAAQGWDTIQEAYAVKPRIEWLEMLKGAKRRAGEVQDDLEGIVPVQCGPELLDCHATGAKGGFSFRLTCPDFQIMVGSPRREWTISVRYISAGLWAHGLEALRARVLACLADGTTRDVEDFIRVSRADWCFDFYAPHVTEDFKPGEMGMNCCKPAGMKTIERFQMNMGDMDGEIWQRGRVETFTIGAKTGCQVQFYDKSREIDEMSGKTWLYDIWLAGLGFNPWGGGKPADMWRLECRFSSDFLKERNLRRPDEIIAARPELVAEALVKRRLVDNRVGNDDKLSRRAVHPIWSEAFRSCAVDHLLPVGRIVTGRRSELIDQSLKQLAGLLRNCSVLEVGADDAETRAALVKRAMDMLEADPKHGKKVDRAMDRYAAVDFAR